VKKGVCGKIAEANRGGGRPHRPPFESATDPFGCRGIVHTLAEVSARLPESLPDSVPFRAPGVGAAHECPLDPCVLGVGRGHLGLWEEAALSPVGQNATASTQ